LVQCLRPVAIPLGIFTAVALGSSLNFQPSLIGPLIIGKLAGGLLGMLLAYWLAVPKALELGRQEEEDGVLPASVPLH